MSKKTLPRELNAAQVRAMLSGGKAMLFDVREPDEFKAEHIACALSLPLANVPELSARIDLPKGMALIFQCQRGTRGGRACAVAGQTLAGREVHNFTGGIEAWKAAGFPVVKSGGGGVSIFRQVQMVAGSLVAASVLAGFSGYGAGFAVAGFIGAALAVSGLTGWCGMALLLAKMPWNK